MGRATALEFVTDWIAHAGMSYQPQVAMHEAPEPFLAADSRDGAEGTWESAWIDLGGEG